MPLTFAPVNSERASQLLATGGSRGQGLTTIREFLAYADASGEQSAEISPSDFGTVEVDTKDENGNVTGKTSRELRPSAIVAKVKSAALSHNYAVTAVADAGKVVLIRTNERPDTNRAEGVQAERKSDSKAGRKSKNASA